MNILDENIPDDNCQVLRRKRVHVSKIGRGIGRKGMDDEEIIPLLHQLSRATFFTLDEDYYHRSLCHDAYCLVHLDIDEKLVSDYVLRIIKHTAFRTKAKRMGKVLRAHPLGVAFWQLHKHRETHLEWQ